MNILKCIVNKKKRSIIFSKEITHSDVIYNATSTGFLMVKFYINYKKIIVKYFVESSFLNIKIAVEDENLIEYLNSMFYAIYKNNFGVLNKDGITLFVNNQGQTINLKILSKIIFIKRKKYHINYVSFLYPFTYCLFLNNNKEYHFVQLIIVAITLILLVFYFKHFNTALF